MAQIGRLHVLTDTRSGCDPVATVRAALSAGAPVIQVRGPSLSDRELFDLADRVAALCAAAGAHCVVDNRADVALAVGANGVHLGAADLPVPAARFVGRNDLIVGATAREPMVARRLVGQGVDYLGVGPAYSTSTKQGLPCPLGPAGVAQVAEAVDVPVIAIGGVTAARVAQLLAAGAHGVAVVSEVSRAADPAAAVRALMCAIEAGRP